MSITTTEHLNTLVVIERLAARHSATVERMVDYGGLMVTLPDGKKFVISRIACLMANGERELETQFNYMLAKCTSK